jgi:hypothetical protein
MYNMYDIHVNFYPPHYWELDRNLIAQLDWEPESYYQELAPGQSWSFKNNKNQEVLVKCFRDGVKVIFESQESFWTWDSYDSVVVDL